METLIRLMGLSATVFLKGPTKITRTYDGLIVQSEGGLRDITGQQDGGKNMVSHIDRSYAEDIARSLGWLPPPKHEMVSGKQIVGEHLGHGPVRLESLTGADLEEGTEKVVSEIFGPIIDHDPGDEDEGQLGV